MRQAAVLVLLGGCVHASTEVRTERVRVETDPPGAYVARMDGGTERVLGRAPLDIDLEYAVEKREFDSACWAWPAASLAVVAGGVGLAAATWTTEEVRAGPIVGGLLALFALPSAITGGIYCGVAAGTAGERPSPRVHDLRVTRDGHQPQTFRTTVPPGRTERVLLVPEGG